LGANPIAGLLGMPGISSIGTTGDAADIVQTDDTAGL
jgi:hypothetical protein